MKGTRKKTRLLSDAKIKFPRTKNSKHGSYSQNLGEGCADYTCSLYKLRLKFVQTSAEVSRKCYVLTNLSACTHESVYVYLSL